MPNWSIDSFQIGLPEIYQIELTNSCQLNCPACIRNDPRVKRPIGYMDFDLIKKMFERGDFEGSYFVELQMAGEPLLHPKFDQIAEYLHTYQDKFKIGISTNGILIKEHLEGINYLDYITISIDSPDKTRYECLRPGANYNNLLSNIDRVVSLHGPKIDLQVIKFTFQKSKLPALIKLAKEMGWKDVTCREVPDCFIAYRSDDWPKERIHELCLNPWLSVSIQWSGEVVPCCFSFGTYYIYGNVKQDSLEHIWQSSDVRRVLMWNMRLNGNVGHMPCSLCYQRSPVLLHLIMLRKNMEDIKNG